MQRIDRNFSLVKNRYGDGLVLLYGEKRNATAYCTYEGELDRDIKVGDDDGFVQVSTDRNSIMAWHGEYTEKFLSEEYPSVMFGKVEYIKNR